MVDLLRARWEIYLRQRPRIQASVNLSTKTPILSPCSCSLNSPPVHHSLRPVAKKSKPALPSGLLPDASVSRVNLTTQFAKSTKVPTTRTSTPADDPNFSSRYGGILDSDMAESSPPMVMAKTAKKKVSHPDFLEYTLTISQSIAKINRGAPAVKLEAMETPVGGRPRAIRRKEIYNQTHLPPGTLALWKTHLIPAWRDLAGTRVNAWHTTLPELCDELKEIWDIIYPSRTQEIIELDGPIFGVVRNYLPFHALV